MTGKRALSRSAFLKRVKDTVKRYDMLHKGDRVLAAVSGGADSVCLLKALLDMRKGLGIEVIAANMDHGIRGKESEADSDFVKSLSEKFKLKYVHKKVNLASGRGKGGSFEEQAREKRYAFFRKAAMENKCNVIATGHTMDDQAETILMRVIYGSSLAGITGIPPFRTEGALRIVRPLIRVERRDILDFLDKDGLEYTEDSTNLDVKYLRNKVRHEVLPFLEKYNPRLRRSLVNLSDTLREDLLFISTEKEKIIKKHAPGGGSAVCGIKIKDIILQPKTLRKEIFKVLFKRAGGNVKKLTYRHWMDMDYFLRAAEKNKSLDFPGNIRVTKRRDEVVFARRRNI
ncbi:MAG: tRNA lysidine(34) synthetase TilS [Candidatus Omnitrophota bacterium]